MLNLANTTDKIQLTTSAASTVDVHVSWVDLATSTVSPNRTNTAITTATTTDILAAPASSTVRNAKMINVRNKDVALTNDITVIYNQNGTSFQLFKASLLPGDVLEYIEGVGWYVISGLNRFVGTYMTLADVTESSSAFATITGLQWAVKAGRHYVFEAQLFYQTAATTTGAQFGITGPATPTLLIVSNMATVTPSVTGAAFSSGTVTAYDTAITAQTTGPGTTNVPATISGSIVPSADGTVSLRMKSEVAASALTVKAGSWVEVRETDN